MKGILSFEMIRAGTDTLRDAGVPEHVAQAVFDAMHSAAQPESVGKPHPDNPHVLHASRYVQQAMVGMTSSLNQLK